jgi:hypothetical protein
MEEHFKHRIAYAIMLLYVWVGKIKPRGPWIKSIPGIAIEFEKRAIAKSAEEVRFAVEKFLINSMDDSFLENILRKDIPLNDLKIIYYLLVKKTANSDKPLKDLRRSIPQIFKRLRPKQEDIEFEDLMRFTPLLIADCTRYLLHGLTEKDS